MAQQEAVQISPWLGGWHRSLTCAAFCGAFIVLRFHEMRPRGQSVPGEAATD